MKTRNKNWMMLGVMMVGVYFMSVVTAEGSVVINEILADPASGLTGDANGDGFRSGTQDEFVELLNFGDTQVDISGWWLEDGVRARHTFLSDTILLPYQYLAVFGGGAPSLPVGIDWQLASTGGLGLNNSGDVVTLFDTNSTIIDQIIYTSALGNKNQSMVRWSEGDGSYVLHASVSQAQGALFSPGTRMDGQLAETPYQSTVPEPSSLICLLIGAAGIFFRGRGKF